MLTLPTPKDNQDIINKTNYNMNCLDYQNYYLIKDNSVYKFRVEKRKEEVAIISSNYEFILNLNLMQIFTNKFFNDIDAEYEDIKTLFEQNKVAIKKIIHHKSMSLYLRIYDNSNNKEKIIELSLKYNTQKPKNLILNDLSNQYYKLKKEINNLNKKINCLENEISELKSNINSKKNKNRYSIDSQHFFLNDQSNPKNIKYSQYLTNDSFASHYLENTFCTFNSINNILNLVYTNDDRAIIFYDIYKNKKLKKIKNAHKDSISNFRHFLDKMDQRDLIISVSCTENNIKLWNANTWECLTYLDNINTSGELNSACFLNNNMQTFIITSNDNGIKSNSDPIKVFDLKGNKIKEINDSNYTTFFIDSFYDDKYSKNYIITSNYGYIKSYDFNKNEVYRKYCDNDNRGHFSIIINNDKKNIKLIESVCDGNIRIWNFHNAILLKKIKACNCRIFGICLWDNNNLFVCCEDKTIKLIDIKNGDVIKSLSGHTSEVVSIKKIYHPRYKNCLISQGAYDEQIKIWLNDKNLL